MADGSYLPLDTWAGFPQPKALRSSRFIRSFCSRKVAVIRPNMGLAPQRMGVVNLLRGQPPPTGPSLQEAYLPFNAACVVAVVTLISLCGWAARTRRRAWSLVLLGVAISIVITLSVSRLNARMLWAFAPDVALVVAAALLLLCLPAALRAGAWARRAFAGTGQ